MMASVLLSSAAYLLRINDIDRPTSPTEVRLTLLSVGAGSCAVAELADGQTFIFDAGSSTYSDVARRVIVPFLYSRGIQRVDGLILSHANFDHFGAATALLDRYPKMTVYLTEHFVADSVNNPPAQHLLRRLQNARSPPVYLHGGDQIHLTDSVYLEALWPVLDSPLHGNDASLMVRLRSGRQSVLFPGDLQKAGQQALLVSGLDLSADVLIAPHHGSLESSTAQFIKAVNPKAVIASDGRVQSQKQKDFEKIVEVPLFRTHRDGAVTVRLSGSGELSITPFRNPNRTLQVK